MREELTSWTTERASSEVSSPSFLRVRKCPFSSKRECTEMNMFGMTWEEIFALLLTAMGPVGITMTYIPIALALPPAMRRQLARRTILVGFIVAVGLMLIGGGIVQSLQLSSEVLVRGFG